MTTRLMDGLGGLVALFAVVVLAGGLTAQEDCYGCMVDESSYGPFYECDPGPVDWGWESCVVWNNREPCEVEGECGFYDADQLSLDGTYRSLSTMDRVALVENVENCEGLVVARAVSQDHREKIRQATRSLAI